MQKQRLFAADALLAERKKLVMEAAQTLGKERSAASYLADERRICRKTPTEHYCLRFWVGGKKPFGARCIENVAVIAQRRTADPQRRLPRREVGRTLILLRADTAVDAKLLYRVVVKYLRKSGKFIGAA